MVEIFTENKLILRGVTLRTIIARSYGPAARFYPEPDPEDVGHVGVVAYPQPDRPGDCRVIDYVYDITER